MQVQQWILMTGKILQDKGAYIPLLFNIYSDIQIKSDINAIYHSL